MVYRLGVIFLIASCVSVALALPPCVCNRNLKPVCGSDGQTYNNECLLNCAASKNPDLRLERPGNCRAKRAIDDDSFCICPENIDPVCGTDGETYENPCALKCAQSKKSVEIQYEGPCRPKRQANDDYFCGCPYDIDPVCGTDGETYSNPCLLECEKKRKYIEIKYEGPCRPKRQINDDLCLCPSNIDPVCGSDGETYPNACTLKCEQSKKNVQIQYEGPCRPKRQVNDDLCLCPSNIDPVCGTDGETYPNACTLKCEQSKKNVQVQYQGPCRPKRQVNVQALCACSFDIDPVCGTDGKTYSNPCLLECEKSKKNVAMQYEGPCRPKRQVNDGLCLCPSNIDPVCGTDGETYDNPCMLKCEQSNKNVQMQYRGPCRPKRQADDFICSCPANINPVCGTDGKTYANPCLLGCEQPKKNIQVQYEGPCRPKREAIEKTLCACPDNIAPVCGSDGQTYPNPCLLQCEGAKNNVHVQHEGECRNKRASDDIFCACPANIDPVCGSDGRTYPNRCLLTCKQNVAVKHEGPCRSKREEIQVAALNLPKCECESDAKPVCGNDGLTYQNPCLLDCAKAFNANLVIEHDGNCEVKQENIVSNLSDCTCTRNLFLVCASNGVTYNNSCLMKCASKDLTIAHNGPCDATN